MNPKIKSVNLLCSNNLMAFGEDLLQLVRIMPMNFINLPQLHPAFGPKSSSKFRHMPHYIW